MASNLRVDNIQPSTAMGIGIGTANGSVTFNADVTGGLNVTNGSVGIGTDTPTQDLEIQDDTLPTVIVRNRTSSSYARVLLDEVGDAGGGFTINRLGSTSSAVGGARAGQIWNHANAPIVFGTNNTEAARFNTSGNLAFPSGQGIDFSATSDTGGMTSELLDDYEEGTFTPVFGGSVTNPTYTSTADGYYTKIGNQVTCWGLIIVNGTTANGSGNWYITSLPYASASGLSYRQNGIIGYNDALTNEVNKLYIAGGTSFCQIIPNGVTQSNETYNSNAIKTGYFSFTITYRI